MIVRNSQLISPLLFVALPRADGFVHACRMDAAHRQRRLVRRMHDPNLPRIRQERPHCRDFAALVFHVVRAQDFGRIGVSSVHNRADTA